MTGRISGREGTINRGFTYRPCGITRTRVGMSLPGITRILDFRSVFVGWDEMAHDFDVETKQRSPRQRLTQVFDQIVHVLDADGQPHERRVYFQGRPGDRGVRHRRGQLDQALDPAQ